MAYKFIICEYNPLHLGHIYHINQTKKNENDKIICIMSGNAVQRGELAIKDKYTRASWAIKAGADLVLELPTKYVLAPAEIFALGGIKIIKHFKNESILSFGSECGDIDTLYNIAELLEEEDLVVELKKNLIRGMSYPTALNAAVQVYCLENGYDDFSEILNNPNNTLGIEYIKALNSVTTKCSPETICRENNYNDTNVKGIYASASAIRANINDSNFVSKYCPGYVANTLSTQNIDIESKLFSLLKYNLSTVENWKNISGVTEGIENRIVEKLNTSTTYSELIEAIKSKRYTLARIKRLLLNGLINNTTTEENIKNESLKYIRVLAVKNSSKNLLSLFDIPLITSSNDFRINELNEDLTDINTDKLYQSICYNYKPMLKTID